MKALTPWIALAIVSVLAILVSLWQYSSHQVELLQITNKSQEQVIEAQKDTIRIQGQDMQLLDSLAKKSQTLAIKQQDLTKKLNEIPDTSNDHPFINHELSVAAGIVRDYQTKSINETPNNNN